MYMNLSTFLALKNSVLNFYNFLSSLAHHFHINHILKKESIFLEVKNAINVQEVTKTRESTFKFPIYQFKSSKVKPKSQSEYLRIRKMTNSIEVC